MARRSYWISLIHRISLILSLAAGVACGQQSPFAGVLAGPVFDPPTNSIRMILGYPGAARVGQPVYTDLDDAAIAPDGKSAVVLRGSRIAGLRRLDTGSVQEVDFSASYSNLQAAWSPDSQLAVVWFANPDNTATFQLWPVQQAAAPPLATTLSSAAVRCVRLLPDGVLLVAVDDSDRSGIYRIGSNGDVSRIAQSDTPSSIALDWDHRCFYFLSVKAGAVMRQAVDGSTPAEPVVKDAFQDISAPAGLALLKGRNLALADAGASAIFLYSLDTGTLISRIDLESAPDGLLPLAGSDWFILSHRREKPSAVILIDSRSNSVYFVPADDK